MSADPSAGESTMFARIAAIVALAGAVLLVFLVLFNSGSSYTLRANFLDTNGLVQGNDVLIGPARVGTVKSISLTPNGQAQVVLGLGSTVASLPQGTVARIYENSLSGIANKYVVLEPGPSNSPKIPDGGTIGTDHTYSPVNLDQLFDTLDPLTRAGLSGFIRGEATSIQGRALAANRTLKYFAPALASTSQVTSALARDEPAFDGLLVQGAQALGQLASRSQELTALVANTNATTGAIASQSQALNQALSLLPGALTHSTSTFAGLRTTLGALDPLVAASIPASRRLAEFSADLRVLSQLSIPTLGALSGLIHNPSGGGDLTQLLLETPSLAKLGKTAFPRLIQSMTDSQAQVNALREYTPDVAAALTNLGQAGGYYDANGHYTRTQPVFNPFTVNGMNVLEPLPAFLNRYSGQQFVHGRCPGSATQAAADGSNPWVVPGCNPSATLPGP
jgi:phospholipid/cholesterol/gamma-HCH transport system substrate-binding protein